MVIALRDVPTRESDEVQSGVIADFDDDGSLVRLENLSASTVVDTTQHVDFAQSEPEEQS